MDDCVDNAVCNERHNNIDKEIESIKHEIEKVHDNAKDRRHKHVEKLSIKSDKVDRRVTIIAKELRNEMKDFKKECDKKNNDLKEECEKRYASKWIQNIVWSVLGAMCTTITALIIKNL